MAMGSGLGCSLELSAVLNRLRSEGMETALFAESIGAVLVEVADADKERLEKTGLAVPVGRVTDAFELSVTHGSFRATAGMEQLVSAWERPFQEVAR